MTANPKPSYGADTVIGAALNAMEIAYFPEFHADKSDHKWSHNNHAALKKRFALLFRHGTAEAAIVVDGEGKQYRIRTMEELIRVWRHGSIACSFDMTPSALAAIEGSIVLHPVPELQPA